MSPWEKQSCASNHPLRVLTERVGCNRLASRKEESLEKWTPWGPTSGCWTFVCWTFVCWTFECWTIECWTSGSRTSGRTTSGSLQSLWIRPVIKRLKETQWSRYLWRPGSLNKDPSWHSGVEPIIQMSGFGDLVLKWPHNNPNWNPTCDLYDVLPREALPSEVHDHGSPEKKR